VVPGDEVLAGLARDTGQALGRAGLRLASAESCTGGWVAKLLTDIPGSSAWFERGLVTYSNAAKIELLAVPADTIETWGAVSEPTVRAMAEGALVCSAADLAVAVSGIAGPGGGSSEKPVGTVWLAWAGKGLATEAHSFLFPGDRDAVRRQAVAAALEGLLARLARG
jgi:nicotinamide-nucleotide amidase